MNKETYRGELTVLPMTNDRAEVPAPSRPRDVVRRVDPSSGGHLARLVRQAGNALELCGGAPERRADDQALREALAETARLKREMDELRAKVDMLSKRPSTDYYGGGGEPIGGIHYPCSFVSSCNIGTSNILDGADYWGGHGS
jgi:hypothetical protein